MSLKLLRRVWTKSNQHQRVPFIHGPRVTPRLFSYKVGHTDVRRIFHIITSQVTVQYRTRVLRITLAKIAKVGDPTRYVFVDFFKIEAWLCQNYHTRLYFYVGENNLPNIRFVSTMVTEKLECENLMSDEGSSVWENWAGEGTSMARVIRWYREFANRRG